MVGVWHDALDLDDRRAYRILVPTRSRVDLFGMICAAEGARPFGLTALKDHINGKCVCDGEAS